MIINEPGLVSEVRLRYRSAAFTVRVKKPSFFGKIFGLMFRTKNTNNLFFEFRKNRRPALHSLFVFFPFIVLWIDDKNNIVDMKIAKLFEFYINSKKKFKNIVEIPISRKNARIADFFVGRERFKYIVD